MLLYHGSKAGISGPIEPSSRDRCDFGRGFYMGTETHQPLTLICNFPAPVLYTVDLDLAPLKVLKIPTGLDWALFVAFNRGKLEAARNRALYARVSSMDDGYDVIAGAIANDRMFIVLDRFFNGDITDIALVASLSALQLGEQYAAITQAACDRIAIIDAHEIGNEETTQLRSEAEIMRASGIARAEEICRRYRREGRYFDEIVQLGE